VCYTEADRCGESYLKMDSAIFLDEELKVHPSFVTSMAANRDRHIHVAKEAHIYYYFPFNILLTGTVADLSPIKKRI
jgi:hypothetical protein